MKILTGIYLGSATQNSDGKTSKRVPSRQTPALILKAIFHRFHLGVELVLLAGILWFVTSHWKNRIKPEAA
jgi:hypothetical protein